MERKEISNIAQAAADKITISKRCLEKAYHIYEAHEYAHAASGSALKKDKESAERYLNLMRFELEVADLPRETLEDLGEDIVAAAQWVKQESTQAVVSLGRFLDKTKELMFQEVVECECGEAKAIERKLGKEALHKILEGGNPGNPCKDNLKITRPSDSPWKEGQVVTKVEFDEMVAAVKKLGGEPPLGEPATGK